jgi:TRAP-type C4-dicarboxylate transport system substrate-binding protein
VGTSPYQVFSKKEVRLPGDIVGLKMRAAGGDADDFLREMGVPVVNMPSSQMYEALERGVLDATLYPPSAAPSRHLEEVTTHFTENAPLMTPLVTYFIDLDRYNSFTPEQQAIIDEASRKTALAMAAEYDKRNEEYKKTLTDAGVVMTVLTEEERQAWRDTYSGAADAFISKISGRGFDYVDEVYAEILDLAEKHAE